MSSKQTREKMAERKAKSMQDKTRLDRFDYAILVGLHEDGHRSIALYDVQNGVLYDPGKLGKLTAGARYDTFSEVLDRYLTTGVLDKQDRALICQAAGVGEFVHGGE